METSAPQPKIIEVDISDEVKKSYLSYAMSVIVGRALPDVRDGLKPVHRRILYAMYLMSLWHNKPYKKSARVVGEVLGKFHPHGDQAIYDTLVRMAQDFVMNIPLIDGHGNFGSIDGDSPAAMRYTEVRLSKAAEKLLEDIDKQTVDFVPNFDASLKEPLILPAKIPNLLVNGSVGIAVGMATNIPPHNLNEVVDALKYLIHNRHRIEEISVKEIMSFIKGPDFPTGGIIYDNNKLEKIYETGRGSIEIWSKAEIEEGKIIIKEIPYLVNKSRLVEEIANLVKENKVEGIKDIRDESNREGIRVVVELKKDVNEEKILNILYATTSLKTNFPIMCVALKGLEPKQMSLKEMLHEFIKHRFEVHTRKYQYELKKAEEKKHILDGMIIAISNIDETVKLIKTSKNREESRNKLMQRFGIDEIQANAILDMPLVRLTALETQKIKEEIEELENTIKVLKDLLGDENKIYDKIVEELESIKKEFGFERKTEIYSNKPSHYGEIKDENMYILVYTSKNYLKKINIEEFRIQKRGGKGVSVALVEGDAIKGACAVRGYEKICIFSSKGKAYNLNVEDIEISKRHTKGKTIYAYIESFESDEKIVDIIPLRTNHKDVVFISKKGIIKRTPLQSYANIRKTGIIALGLKGNDELADVDVIQEEDTHIFIATKKGKGLRFLKSKVRELGRSAMGMKGIKLKDEDEALKIMGVKESDEIIVITSRGHGKKLKVSDIPTHGRGSGGVKISSLKEDESLSTITKVEGETLTVITEKGMIIKIPIDTIPQMGRNSRGVRIINIKDDAVKDVVLSDL